MTIKFTRHILPLLSVYIVFTVSCSSKHKLFDRVSPEYSGILFNNRIEENDTLNPLDITNIYNGGGIGIGDFNNDGLQDIYFTGNVVENKLYLNKGDFKFEDVTKEAGVTGDGKWCRGVSVVDINNDGWMDMYVCASMLKDAHKRENLLYINLGVNTRGIPQFKEMAAEYGLNDSTHSTMAAFFDYDNDGDLDLFLSNGNPDDLIQIYHRDVSYQEPPLLFHGSGNRLRDVSAESGPIFAKPLSARGLATGDFDNDGAVDVLISMNDGAPLLLR